MVENWQIILAIIVVGLSIVMPIYYSHQKKKKAQRIKKPHDRSDRQGGRCEATS